MAPNPMHVENAREVPEYEIDPKELDFTNSVSITKVFTHHYLVGSQLLLSYWLLECC